MAMTLRLSPEVDEQLSQLTEKQGISKQQAATQAISDAWRRSVRRAEIDAGVTDFMSRYGEAFDELSRT